MIRLKKGFTYSYTEEQIRAYSKLSTREKLKWLEEANRFCAKAITGRRKKIWEKFRKGEI